MGSWGCVFKAPSNWIVDNSHEPMIAYEPISGRKDELMMAAGPHDMGAPDDDIKEPGRLRGVWAPSIVFRWIFGMYLTKILHNSSQLMFHSGRYLACLFSLV